MAAAVEIKIDTAEQVIAIMDDEDQAHWKRQCGHRGIDPAHGLLAKMATKGYIGQCWYVCGEMNVEGQWMVFYGESGYQKSAHEMLRLRNQAYESILDNMARSYIYTVVNSDPFSGNEESQHVTAIFQRMNSTTFAER